MKKYLLLLLAPLIFVGCGGSLKLYTLDIRSEIPRQASAYAHKSLRIEYPELMDSGNSKEMLYAYGPNERGVYQNAQWNDNKGRMLMHSFWKGIENGKVFGRVTGYDGDGKTDYALSTYVYEFYHKAYRDESVSVVSIRFDLADSSTGAIVKSRKFRYEVPTQSFDAHGYAAATQHALEMLSNDLNRWLAR